MLSRSIGHFGSDCGVSVARFTCIDHAFHSTTSIFRRPPTAASSISGRTSARVCAVSDRSSRAEVKNPEASARRSRYETCRQRGGTRFPPCCAACSAMRGHSPNGVGGTTRRRWQSIGRSHIRTRRCIVAISTRSMDGSWSGRLGAGPIPVRPDRPGQGHLEMGRQSDVRPMITSIIIATRRAALSNVRYRAWNSQGGCAM